MGFSLPVLSPFHSRGRGFNQFNFAAHDCGRTLLCIVWLAMFLSACSGDPLTSPTVNATSSKVKQPLAPPDLSCPSQQLNYFCDNDENSGISGLARISADCFLVVHDQIKHGKADTYDNDAAPRIRILHIDNSSAAKAPVFKFESTTVDWSSAKRISNDLESACRLDGLPGYQFLIAESGKFDTKYGHIFHIELTLAQNQAPAVTIKSGTKLELPDINTVPDAHSIQEYEGMACDRVARDRYIVILGERGGGSAVRPFGKGRLRWGFYTPSTMSFDWGPSNWALPNIIAPRGTKPHADIKWRDITGLHIDTNRRLWASAAFDSGENARGEDVGPFDSVVYQLGYICVSKQDKHGHSADCDYTSTARPQRLAEADLTVAWQSPDRKIEAVATPAGVSQASYHLAIGTEDEDVGAIFLPRQKLK